MVSADGFRDGRLREGPSKQCSQSGAWTIAGERGLDHFLVQTSVGLAKALDGTGKINQSPLARSFQEANRAGDAQSPADGLCPPFAVIHENGYRLHFPGKADGLALPFIHAHATTAMRWSDAVTLDIIAAVALTCLFVRVVVVRGRD